jgi:hypothetical protein
VAHRQRVVDFSIGIMGIFASAVTVLEEQQRLRRFPDIKSPQCAVISDVKNFP